MADKRRARRESDPGLQPERTSLAWFRTLLGYGALMALAIKPQLAPRRPAVLAVDRRAGDCGGDPSGGYTRRRHLMDVDDSDFYSRGRFVTNF